MRTISPDKRVNINSHGRTCDFVKDVQRESLSWVILTGPILSQEHSCKTGRGRLEANPQRRGQGGAGDDGMMQADAAVLRPQAKECP